MLRFKLIVLISAMLALTLSACSQNKAMSKDDAGRWVHLFNGEDLSGFKQIGAADWQIDDGTLVGVQGSGHIGGDLISEQEYDDFILSCTFRVEWPANSGVWFRYQSPGVSFQADILEWKDPVCYSGSLYCPGKMFIAMNEDPDLVNRDGWNTLKIMAVGDHLQVWLNGTQVADVHDDTSNFGAIGLQVHEGEPFAGMKIVVKELKVKPLP